MATIDRILKQRRVWTLATAMVLMCGVIGAATPAGATPATRGVIERNATVSAEAAPASAAASDLTITVDPATGLPRQTVDVVVGGVDDPASASLIECPAASDDFDGCLYLGGPEVRDDGTTGAEVRVFRHLVGEDGLIDCVEVSCEVLLYADLTSVSASISFDPDATVVGPPLLIAPAAPFGDGEIVLLGGSGLPADAEANAVECPASSGFECRVGSDTGVPLGFSTTSAGGGLLMATRLARHVNGVDCASAPGACEVRVTFDFGIDLSARASLTFDLSIPPRPAPSVTVSPSTGLRDGDEVAVEGRSFLPNSLISAQQCLADFSHCRGYASEVADASGSVATTFKVARRVSGLDCAVAGCVLLVVNDSGSDRVETPLEFDASIPPPPGPSLTVTPTTDLVDLQSVHVEAAGLGDDSYVYVEQCDAAGQACRFTADGSSASDGTFSADVGVRRILRGPDGVVDCATSPDDCILRLSASGDEEASLDQPLQFDPEGPLPPSATARVVPGTGLVDGELARVLGSGFDPGEALSLAECVGEPPAVTPTTADDCEVLRSFSVRPSADGRLDYRVRVHRRFEDSEGTSRDCAVEKCSLLVAGPDSRAVVRLRFSPRGEGLPDFPAQLSCVSWPTRGWPTGPLPDGVDPAVMDRIANDSLVNRSSVNSILVVHGGRLVFERYREGFGQDKVFSSFSMAKSMTSSIIGMLIEEGQLQLDGPAPVPQWADPADPRHAISIRNLLNMSSGLRWNENYYDMSSDVLQMLNGSGVGDMAGYAASRPLDREPGTYWQYSTGDTMILAGIIARTVGTGATLDAYLHERLFDPIGMGPMRLGFDGSGVWVGGARADTTSRSFAKFGLLYMRGGVWDGKKVLADGWAQYARTPAPTDPGYGAQFWLDDQIPGSFSAVGFLGQRIQIVPELDLVIVVNSATGNDADMSGIIDQFTHAAPPGCGTMRSADDATTVAAGESVTIPVLGNDHSTGGPVEINRLSLIDLPEQGTVHVIGRQIVYTAPDTGSAGTQTLIYEICNRRRDCDEATVTINVT